MNAKRACLMDDFKSEKVVVALKQMHPTKGPSPNGTPVLFYKHSWEIVGKDVTDLVLYILNGEGDPTCINKTQTVWIPKVNNPIHAGEVRPISMCNINFKLFTKTIANRLKNSPWHCGRESECFCSKQDDN